MFCSPSRRRSLHTVSSCAALAAALAAGGSLGGGPSITLTPETTSLPGDVLTLTVEDATPWEPVGVNDCNGNGVADMGLCGGAGPVCDSDTACGGGCGSCVGLDDTDCSGDCVADVVSRLLSEAEPDGELVFLDLVGAETYAGTIAVSTRHDVPGVLLVRTNGTSPAIARAIYVDEGGTLEDTTTLTLTAGRVVIREYAIADNGDADIFADTNETVELSITVVNKSGMDLTDVVARLFTTSDTIDCVLDGVSEAPLLDDGAMLTLPEPFTFKVGPVARAGVFDDLSATFSVTFQSAEIDLTAVPEEIVLDLDLDVAGGAGPITFAEDFEGGTLGAFSAMSLDGPPAEGANPASDGYRCQYTDPDDPGGNTFGEPFCYVGFAPGGGANAFDWHNHNLSAPDGGRAFSGTRSLHFGAHSGPTPADDTLRLSQLDAVRLTNPINLRATAIPELSFKQQVSVVGSDILPIPPGETLDRAVVQLQLADGAGTPVGPWFTLRPYHNVYDAQGTDIDLDMCMFDPVDDGNDEDAFFSSTDPAPRFGPSSTCYTGHSFAFQGDTDGPFDPLSIGNASDGPGLSGTGPGTWVETRFNLARHRGRRIRIRFLATTGKAMDLETYLAAGIVPAGDPADDGWYIDDFRVTNALAAPATLAPDLEVIPDLPVCPAPCAVVAASLTADPPSLDLGGGSLTLSAGDSMADQCPSGTLQYQFWIDADNDGVLAEPADVRLRDWTDHPELSTSQASTTVYGVRVRCSSAPTCDDTASVRVRAGTPGEVLGFLVGKEPGGEIVITYTPTCNALDNTIVYGPVADLDTSGYTGQICDIGNTGSYGPFDLGTDSYFFLVVANDDGADGFEGSYGLDSDMKERPQYESPPSCSFSQDLTMACR